MKINSVGNVNISQGLTLGTNIITNSGVSEIRNYLYIYNPDGRITHLPYSGNNQNYIRGKLNIDQDSLYVGGFVGIGINPPSYLLHVGSQAVITSLTNTYIYQTSTFLSTLAGTYNRAICAKFDNDIWTAGYLNYSSDQRIKKNIQDIEDDSALQLILKVQPKTYNYIDVVERGNETVYGFIAQQIKEVIPRAVTINKDFIPNIYSSFDCNENTISILNSTLKIGDIIQVLDNLGKKNTFNIVDVTPNNITIDQKITGDRCFVIGSQVDDFHTINKDYIYTLNVCAVQELYKLIQELNNKVSNLENIIKKNNLN